MLEVETQIEEVYLFLFLKKLLLVGFLVRNGLLFSKLALRLVFEVLAICIG